MTEPPNAWPRPWEQVEEPRSHRPLELLYEKSSAPMGVWRPIVVDEDWRCFSFIWPRALSSELSAQYKERILKTAPWVELKNTKGTSVTRLTCWYTRGGCNCDYTYGREIRMENSSNQAAFAADADDDGSAPSNSEGENEDIGCPSNEDEAAMETSANGANAEFLGVMREITDHIFGKLFPGLPQEAWPNCANVNLYRDGRQAVGWHADDEVLFKGKDCDVPIVSVSLGATREFWIALKRSDNSMEPDTRTITEVDLQDGDVLTMEGRMQRHCMHLVPKVNPREPLREERVNITFRWVREHRFRCPLRRRRSRVPRSLRGLFGLFGEATRKKGKAIWSSGATPFSWRSYVRCWSREVMAGVLADPNTIGWQLCDGCKHKCFEEGRPCCEGRGEWAGMWFCRKCWMHWEPESITGLPLGPMAPSNSQSSSALGANLGAFASSLDPFMSGGWAAPNDAAAPCGVEALQAWWNAVAMAAAATGAYGTAQGQSLHGHGTTTLTACSTAINANGTEMARAKSEDDEVCAARGLSVLEELLGKSASVEGSTASTEASGPAPSTEGSGLAASAESSGVVAALLGGEEEVDERDEDPSHLAPSGEGQEFEERDEDPYHRTANGKEPELAHSWCSWLRTATNGAAWSEAQRQLHGATRSMWELRHFALDAHAPSCLRDEDLSVFHTGVMPAREDPAFKRGGRWILAVGAGSRKSQVTPELFASVVDRVWKALVQAMVEGVLDAAAGGAHVRGAAASARVTGEGQALAAKLSVWVSDASHRAEVRSIGGRVVQACTASVPESDAPRIGWQWAYEDFRQKAVTLRAS